MYMSKLCDVTHAYVYAIYFLCVADIYVSCVAVCVAVCCSVLQCVAVSPFNDKTRIHACVASMYVLPTSMSRVLQRGTVRCSVLQCVAVCCSVLQCLCLWRHASIHILSATKGMGWLQSEGSIKLQVSFAKETYKRDYILQKRPIISSILLTVATP